MRGFSGVRLHNNSCFCSLKGEYCDCGDEHTTFALATALARFHVVCTVVHDARWQSDATLHGVAVTLCRAEALAPTLRLRSLRRLTAAVHSHPTSLFGSPQGNAKGCLSLPPCSSEVVDAVWGVARLSTQLQDGAMAALAGESGRQAPRPTK